jgi:hypothetical protein
MIEQMSSSLYQMNKKKPVMALVDISRRNKVEGIILDERRAGKWNTSFWDPKLEETFPLRGLHPEGKLLPTSTQVLRTVLDEDEARQPVCRRGLDKACILLPSGAANSICERAIGSTNETGGEQQ